MEAERTFHTDLKALMQFPRDGIFSKVLVKTKTYSYTLMCLSRNTDIDTHTSAKNGMVYVLEGSGIFHLEGEDISMSPGVMIHMIKNAPHALKADSDLAILLCLTD